MRPVTNDPRSRFFAELFVQARHLTYVPRLMELGVVVGASLTGLRAVESARKIGFTGHIALKVSPARPTWAARLRSILNPLSRRKPLVGLPRRPHWPREVVFAFRIGAERPSVEGPPKLPGNSRALVVAGETGR